MPIFLDPNSSTDRLSHFVGRATTMLHQSSRWLTIRRSCGSPHRSKTTDISLKGEAKKREHKKGKYEPDG